MQDVCASSVYQLQYHCSIPPLGSVIFLCAEWLLSLSSTHPAGKGQSFSETNSPNAASFFPRTLAFCLNMSRRQVYPPPDLSKTFVIIKGKNDGHPLSRPEDDTPWLIKLFQFGQWDNYSQKWLDLVSSWPHFETSASEDAAWECEGKLGEGSYGVVARWARRDEQGLIIDVCTLLHTCNSAC